MMLVLMTTPKQEAKDGKYPLLEAPNQEQCSRNSRLGEMLSATTVEAACGEQGHVWRRSFWSPSVTLATFLIQVLSAEKTLRAAVASLLTQLAAAGESVLPSGDATAYCQARQRFPEAVIGRMLRHSVTRLRARITKDNGWLGRRVWMVDGSGVSMPDTPELQ